LVLDPVAISAISIGFGILFLMGAVHKVTALAGFRAILADYRLFPRKTVNILALAVVGIEGSLGLGWLFLPDRQIVALATIILLLLYGFAIAVNLHRGRTHISCGCSFGQSAGGADVLSGWLVARNLLLAAMAAVAFLPVAERSFGILDYLSLAAALASGTLLFAAGNQLIRNRAAFGNWRQSTYRNE
jgi:hypothetical protein